MAEKFTIEDIMRELEMTKKRGEQDKQESTADSFTKEMHTRVDLTPPQRRSTATQSFTETRQQNTISHGQILKTQPGPDTIQFEQIRQDKVDHFLQDFSFKGDQEIHTPEQALDQLSSNPSGFSGWNLDELDDDLVILQDDQLEEEEEETKKKRFPFLKKNKRRATEEEAEEVEEEEDEEHPDEYRSPSDVDYVNDLLSKQRTLSLMRLGATTLSFILLLYLAISNFVALLPLPPFMYPEVDMRTFMAGNLGVLLLSILSSASAIGSGLINLFTLKADSDSAASLAAIAAFAQGIALTINPEFISYGQGHFYFVAAALILMFGAIGNYLQILRVIENFGVVSSGAQKKVLLQVKDLHQAEAIVAPQSLEEPKVVYGAQTDFPRGFMQSSFGEGESLTRFIVPLCLVFAIIISVVSYLIFDASAMSALTYLTAMLVISCPLSIALIYNLPLYRSAKLLAPKGGCLLGEEAVNSTEEAAAILLTGGDLYYGKNAPVYGIKPFDTDSLNRSIIQMVSIAFALNMPAKQSLLNIINNDSSLLLELDSYQIIPQKGVVAYIEGQRVLMGNRELMKMFGLSVPGDDYENKLKGNKKDLLYISGGERLSAVFVVGYSAPSSVARALAKLNKYGIGLSVSSADPNITTKRIAKDFQYTEGYINLVEASASIYCERVYTQDKEDTSGIILPAHPAMLLRCFNACFSIKRSINLATIIQMVGLILGYAAVSFLAFTGSMDNLSFINMVIFQIIAAIASSIALLSSKT